MAGSCPDSFSKCVPAEDESHSSSIPHLPEPGSFPHTGLSLSPMPAVPFGPGTHFPQVTEERLQPSLKYIQAS